MAFFFVVPVYIGSNRRASTNSNEGLVVNSWNFRKRECVHKARDELCQNRRKTILKLEKFSVALKIDGSPRGRNSRRL